MQLQIVVWHIVISGSSYKQDLTYTFSFLLLLTHCFATLQLSFQMWTDQMQETLNSKKKGDAAFRQKDFRAAIDCYTQVSFCLCHVCHPFYCSLLHAIGSYLFFSIFSSFLSVFSYFRVGIGLQLLALHFVFILRNDPDDFSLQQ